MKREGPRPPHCHVCGGEGASPPPGGVLLEAAQPLGEAGNASRSSRWGHVFYHTSGKKVSDPYLQAGQSVPW